MAGHEAGAVQFNETIQKPHDITPWRQTVGDGPQGVALYGSDRARHLDRADGTGVLGTRAAGKETNGDQERAECRHGDPPSNIDPLGPAGASQLRAKTGGRNRLGVENNGHHRGPLVGGG